MERRREGRSPLGVYAVVSSAALLVLLVQLAGPAALSAPAGAVAATTPAPTAAAGPSALSLPGGRLWMCSPPGVDCRRAAAATLEAEMASNRAALAALGVAVPSVVASDTPQGLAALAQVAAALRLQLGGAACAKNGIGPTGEAAASVGAVLPTPCRVSGPLSPTGATHVSQPQPQPQLLTSQAATV